MSKTIVITGAGTGLGRAMARRLAREGHRIVLLGRRLEKVEAVAAETGGGAWATACDVVDTASVAAAFAAIAAREQRIDVLINNAGVYFPHFIREVTDEQVASMLDTNLAGPVLCTRAALPLMSKDGHVINIGSRTAAVRAAMLSLYQSSKAGLERFTVSLRDEVRDDGIRVTLIRAAGMMGEGMEWNLEPQLMKRFAEERHKMGIDRGENAVSQFDSVAELLPWLVDLPPDVEVTELILEARHA
jgi:NAD(P)-dependent dehydrogenase (short-subunit alcohol dehydrogenase family)